MANENDTTTYVGSEHAIVVHDDAVVSESLGAYTLAPPQTGFAVRFVEHWVPEPYILTPEQEAQRRAYDERRQVIEAWRRRNLPLLHSLLSEAQRDQFQRENWFDVIGSDTKRTYRIHWGSQGNVRLIEHGIETVSYCAGPEDVSVAETMLAQKLQLEHNEPAFLAIANATCMATGERIGGAILPRLREWWSPR